MNVGMQHIAIKAPFEMQLVVPVFDFVWVFLRTAGSELLVSAVVAAPHQVAAQGNWGTPNTSNMKHPQHCRLGRGQEQQAPLAKNTHPDGRPGQEGWRNYSPCWNYGSNQNPAP